jgi:hypothetical protein
MNLDRLWYALWVPMAFAGTILVLKWIVWGFDLVTVILFGLVALLPRENRHLAALAGSLLSPLSG